MHLRRDQKSYIYIGFFKGYFHKKNSFNKFIDDTLKLLLKKRAILIHFKDISTSKLDHHYI